MSLSSKISSGIGSFRKIGMFVAKTPEGVRKTPILRNPKTINEMKTILGEENFAKWISGTPIELKGEEIKRFNEFCWKAPKGVDKFERHTKKDWIATLDGKPYTGASFDAGTNHLGDSFCSREYFDNGHLVFIA